MSWFLLSLQLHLRCSGLADTTPNSFLNYLVLSSSVADTLIRPWTLITNIFIHEGLLHIAGNMLGLYFIGRILEDFFDRLKIWRIFILGGMAGGLLYLIFAQTPLLMYSTGLEGASGGVYAIVIATATLLPLYEVRPFGLFNLKMKHLAFVALGLNVFMLFGTNMGGALAHFGGALTGYLFVLSKQKSLFAIQKKVKPVKQARLKVLVNEEKEHKIRTVGEYRPPNQEEVDSILDKISQSGYDSLSAEEKQKLFEASKNL